jgi:hypothetical protein
MYDIEITYQTGNSFNTYNATDLLDLPVESLSIAKENLQRIKQHWKIYEDKDSFSPQIKDIPDFYIDERGIILKINDTTSHTILSPFWTGYFESLISARIVVLDSDELEFTI